MDENQFLQSLAHKAVLQVWLDESNTKQTLERVSQTPRTLLVPDLVYQAIR